MRAAARRLLPPAVLLALAVSPVAVQGAGDPFAEARFVECTRLIRTFTGEGSGHQFGWVSAPLNDLDGDGAREVVITAPFGAVASAGLVYVYSTGTGQELFRVGGGGAGRNLGFSARDAGDVDGDGFGDVIAGAPFGTRGRARVYSGDPADEGLLLFQSLRGSGATAYGWSVTGLGDLDGDGLSDIAVGDPGADVAGVNAGRAWILSSSDNAQTVLWTIDGEGPGAQLGSAMGRLPDVTGDGRDELIVGARGAGPGGRGEAYVYDVVNQVREHEFQPDASGVDFGLFFTSNVGDVNANGYADVYVGDFADGANGPGSGKAYVFDGDTGIRIWTFEGQAGDGFGIGRGMGDVNGDGHADLLLCGYTHSSGAPGAGQATVFSGKDKSVLQVVTSRSSGEGLGFDAHGIGDVDGDGDLDLFLTAATNNAAGSMAGRCYVVAGGPPVVSIRAGGPGSGGLRPRLALVGCRGGTVVDVALSQAPGGALGLLVVGSSEVSVPLAGATLVASPDVLLPISLDGADGVPGAGRATRSLALGRAPSTLVVQALVVDPAATGGFALTDALRVEPDRP